MALSNEQYDEILREYDRKALRAERLKRERRLEIERRSPGFKALDDEISDIISTFAADMGSDSAHGGATSVKERLNSVKEKRAALIKAAGFPEDYADSVYECPDCLDTGFINGKKCHCFKRRETELLFSGSHLSVLCKDMDFSRLREDIYAADPTGESLSRFRGARDEALKFANDFPDAEKNLLFMGNVGTGKTSISVCVAGELMKRGFSCIYHSAAALFDSLARAHFGSDREAKERLDSELFDCDLLIIDDLGSELTNAFTEEQLFMIIQERSIRGGRIIISTNLDPEGLRSAYGDRTFSRIISGFVILKLTGADIRFRQAMDKR